MVRTALVVAASFLIGTHDGGSAAAQETGVNLDGRWTLNRALSQFPRDVGFGLDLTGVADDGTGQRAAPTLLSGRESEDDAKRARQLSDEVAVPPAHLTISDTPAAVTITDDSGRARTFHPGAREDVIQLDGVPVGAVARREAGRLIVTYRVQQNRDLRYTYSRTLNPAQLVVDVQFIERGTRSAVRRVYEPSRPGEPATTPPPAAAAPARQPPPPPPAGENRPASAGAATEPSFELPRMPQRPGDEFKGLNALSVIVEDLGSQAVSCGLKQAAIEAAATKALSGAGLKILHNSDEDTYLYVNINASKVSTGFCVSRYDVILYTHAAAKMPYGSTPVLVQVSLLRDGGMAGGDPAANGAAVLKGVTQAVEQFAERIRNANR